MIRDPAQIDRLYRETLRLADAARGWFDGPGHRHVSALAPEARASAAIESLRVTARLAAAMAWLVGGARGRPPGVLGEVPPPLPDGLAGTPGEAIASGSRDLALRLAGLDTATASP